jgi:hypothetical protein
LPKPDNDAPIFDKGSFGTKSKKGLFSAGDLM